LEALGDPYPFARFLIRPAVERILGRTLTEREYDIAAPAELREQQLEALLLKETTPP
jgi:hypothetical protein